MRFLIVLLVLIGAVFLLLHLFLLSNSDSLNQFALWFCFIPAPATSRILDAVSGLNISPFVVATAVQFVFYGFVSTPFAALLAYIMRRHPATSSGAKPDA